MRYICFFVVYLLLNNILHFSLVINLCDFLFLFPRLYSSFVKVTVALFCHGNISLMRDIVFYYVF